MREDFQTDDDQAEDTDFSVDDRLIPMRLKHLPGTQRAEAPPAPKPQAKPGFRLLRALFSNLAYTTTVAIVPATAAVMVSLSVWALSVVPEIQAVQGQFLGAEGEYHRRLEGSQPAIAELGSLGATTDQLVQIYFTFTEASGDEARELADVYYANLLNEYASTSADYRGSVPPLLLPAEGQRRLAAAKYSVWQSLLASPRGRLAVVMRAAPTPTPGMQRYASNPTP